MTSRDSHDAAPVRLRPCRGEAEYPRLVEVWRSAVLATHHFLPAADREEIESHLAPDYFPQVRLTVAESVNTGEVVGFSGVVENSLEMLFVHADHHGSGVGTTLLNEAIGRGVTVVDVNEDNPGAVEFYLRRGFVQVGRSELDDAGRPFPLLHLRLEPTASRAS